MKKINHWQRQCLMLAMFWVTCGGINGHAQPPSFSWAVPGWGSSAYDGIGGMAADRTGNVFMTGSIGSPSITLGGLVLTADPPQPMGSPPFGTAFFAAKADASGHVLWVRQAGPTDGANGKSCATDTEGNVYVTGCFGSSNLTLGATILTNQGQENGFLAKINAAGNLLWAIQAGGSYIDSLDSITIDASGYIYVGGFLGSTNAAFGTNILVCSNPALGDRFLAKYDTNGNVMWARQIKGAFAAKLAIACDRNGYCRVAGGFYPAADFGGLTLEDAANFAHGFVAKYDPAGNPVWARETGTGAFTYSAGIAVDPAGNCFVTGKFLDSPQLVFGGITLTNAAAASMYLAKYDADGNLLWARSANPTGNAKLGGPTGIVVDAAGNCHVAGYFGATNVDFGGLVAGNPGGGPNDSMGFIVKYGPDGTPLWAKSAFGAPHGPGSIGFGALAEDGAENIFCAGGWQSSVFDFDGTLPGEVETGGAAIFVAKLDGPRLAFSRVGEQVQIAWPTNAVGLNLQATTNLDGTDWSPVTNSLTVIGNQNTLILDISAAARFFRLMN